MLFAYRQSHVIAILEQIKHYYGEQGYSHPIYLNWTEIKFYAMISVRYHKEHGCKFKKTNAQNEITKRIFEMRVPIVPVLSVLTINRVQDIFQNDVYETDCDAYILEERFSQDRDLQLNLLAYKKHTYDSVHR